MCPAFVCCEFCCSPFLHLRSKVPPCSFGHFGCDLLVDNIASLVGGGGDFHRFSTFRPTQTNGARCCRLGTVGSETFFVLFLQVLEICNVNAVRISNARAIFFPGISDLGAIFSRPSVSVETSGV